jgi:hypothetical protein
MFEKERVLTKDICKLSFVEEEMGACIYIDREQIIYIVMKSEIVAKVQGNGGATT